MQVAESRPVFDRLRKRGAMKKYFTFMLFCLLFVNPARPEHRHQADASLILPGPVTPSVDLRNMLRRHIVEQACAHLEQAARLRTRAFAGKEWPAWRARIRSIVKAEMGELPVPKRHADLHIRPVSQYELEWCDIENVLFESFPGWDVNASLFLPKKDKFPPPWPAIVVPVGHSSKTRINYQRPAQMFASQGYAAVLFDPPGMAGEKQPGNDHFNDGVRCYLTATSSNRYFVLDAIRCLDYLTTRSDIDAGNGFGMTGVSGGGTTTMFAALLDDRIAAIGPACCAMPSIQHPVLDVYAACAETLPFAHYKNGVDDVDLLCAALPIPVLFMYGEKDEVFKPEYSRALARDVGLAFRQAGQSDRFSQFADTCGHAYSLNMAARFVAWMDTWVRKAPIPARPPLATTPFPMLPDSMLWCHPRLDGNMFTVNRALALQLLENRQAVDFIAAVKKVIGLEKPIAPPKIVQGPPFQVWAHELQEMLLSPAKGIELPATLLSPVDQSQHNGAVLFFDERGRWTELRQQKWLADLAHFLQMDRPYASIMTVDLRGWGDTQPADLPYEIAAWGHSTRWIAYVSAAIGDPVLAMRVRDGLASLAALRAVKAINGDKIVVAGYGMGGVVALHVAALDGNTAGVFAVNSLASFTDLAVSEKYAWSHDAFLPNVLNYYDLPDLAARVTVPVLLLNPLDAEKNGLTPARMEKIYSAARQNNRLLQVEQSDRVTSILRPWVEKLIY